MYGDSDKGTCLGDVDRKPQYMCGRNLLLPQILYWPSVKVWGPYKMYRVVILESPYILVYKCNVAYKVNVQSRTFLVASRFTYTRVWPYKLLQCTV